MVQAQALELLLASRSVGASRQEHRSYQWRQEYRSYQWRLKRMIGLGHRWGMVMMEVRMG